MTKEEIDAAGHYLKDEVKAHSKNTASMDAREVAIICKCIDIGASIAMAIVSIAESQRHIAQGTERAWKPGDDVIK